MIAEIAKLTIENGGHVMFIVHRRELIEQIKGTFEAHGVDMNHTTIETVIKTRNRLGKLPEPTVIITDESHHSRAKTYQEIYDYYPHAVHLGFTATPWRLNGEGFEDLFDAIVLGPSVKWLINNYSLAPYKYYSVQLADLEKLRKSSTGDFTKKSMDYAIDKAIYGDVVKNYQKLADGEKAILYAHSVEASAELAETFQKQGIPSAHADATTPKSERDAIMQKFREGEIKVLCNVDLISEGFDVPDCSCVLMVRPTESLVLFLQQSMRCMRYQKDKQAIIIDHVANYERHGLPDDDRKWSLKDRKKKQVDRDTGPAIRQCEFCHGVFYAKGNTKKCPLCGQEVEIQEHEGLQQVEAELKEICITTDYTLLRYRQKNKRELKTLEDWYLYAKAHNYKKGWLKFNVPKLKGMSWPQFYMTLKPLDKKYS